MDKIANQYIHHYEKKINQARERVRRARNGERKQGASFDLKHYQECLAWWHTYGLKAKKQPKKKDEEDGT